MFSLVIQIEDGRCTSELKRHFKTPRDPNRAVACRFDPKIRHSGVEHTRGADGGKKVRVSFDVTTATRAGGAQCEVSKNRKSPKVTSSCRFDRGERKGAGDESEVRRSREMRASCASGL
jgi:hypothetical protein